MKIALVTILIIGDPQQFSFITRLFAENGGKTNVISVSDVKDSVKKIESLPIDVIISRFDLGSLNGIDFITRLKHQIHYNPIMIFVGDEGPAIEKEALKAGIDYYYQKKGDQELETAQLNNFIKLIVKGKQTEESLHYADTNFRTIVEATED